MYALDVEGLQALVDQLRKLRGQRRLLDVVLALKQVDGIRLLAGDLLPDLGWGSCRHGGGRPKGLHYDRSSADLQVCDRSSADLQVCDRSSADLQVCSECLQYRRDDASRELAAQPVERVGVLTEECRRIDRAGAL